MSWLWGRSEKVEVEETLTADEDDVPYETQEADVSDPNGADDDVDGDAKSIHSGKKTSNPEGTNGIEVHSDDGESSGESSYEVTSDSEDDFCDDDDDSLVVDLIESMSTEDEVTDDDISLVDEAPPSAQSSNRGEKHEITETPSKQAGQETLSNPQANNDDADNDGADNDDPVTTFWEKQSLLVLAAEHDRVDILKTLIKDEAEEKDALLNSGIPPLHLAISFGSVNTAQSLLRMGADPSVRPNIDEVLEQRKNQPEDSKVEIPNIRRFENISAWELAFGNALYEKAAKNKSSWSLFGSSGPSESGGANNRIIRPVDMPPSKREGIRHAFTAEALRSVGSDEVDRLKQLVYSGMPTSIDIGGNDLYGWAVDMEALQCEEFLRPVEASKYDKKEGDTAGSENAKDTFESSGDETPTSGADDDANQTATAQIAGEQNSSGFVVHRPDEEETIPQLKNRLDELDSLSNALSVCLDNLAEEVSVCHGLLLMGGGASALASHVRSLRDSKAQKLSKLEDVQAEFLDVERELSDLVASTGGIGKDISKIAKNNLKGGVDKDGRDDHGDNSRRKEETEAMKHELRAQIIACENKIRKLRASIADLSEENTRNLKEVKRRGLEGGINLVRGLREEIRDLDFHLSEVQSMKTACDTKITLILSHVQKKENISQNTNGKSLKENATTQPRVENDKLTGNGVINASSEDIAKTTRSDGISGESIEDAVKSTIFEKVQSKNDSVSSATTPAPTSKDGSKGKKTEASVKIATGDSHAIAVIQPGHKGFFRIDLWEILLRIVGFERAANRRSVQNATRSTSTSGSNIMTV